VNDPQWIRTAVSRYERPLCLYALRIVGDAERARDVVQETFARLIERPPSAPVDANGELAAWLYTVCRNAALDVRRKEKRVMPMIDALVDAVPDQKQRPDEVAESAEASAAVMKLLERLPDDQQEVVRLKFQHQMSYKQIASITGHSESNVGFLIHTAIKAIRARMK
jgi:RNA polymerase sigma-70 factor (ECF subfamily)